MRGDARKRLEEPENPPCPDCGKPEGSFACKIRHIAIDTSWARGDH